jgi:hypothetical protein
MMNYFQLAITMSGVAGSATMLLAMIYLRLTLTRRLRRQLEPRGEYWKSGTLDFGFFNTIIFALACALPYVPRSENYQLMYKDLDVKTKAKPFEQVAAYSMLIGLVLTFLSSLLVVITQQAGWIEWPT